MSKLRFLLIAFVALSLVGGGTVNGADNLSAKLGYHISDAFIQSFPGELAQTGAVAQASNGDQVRVTGSGDFG